MTKKITAAALAFTLTLAFIPTPAKAQVEPPALVDFDNLGRPIRIQSVNPTLHVLEIMTFTWGQNFVSHTFQTQDGILVQTVMERLKETLNKNKTETVDRFFHTDGINFLESVWKTKIEGVNSDVKINLSFNALAVKIDFENDIMKKPEETKASILQIITALAQAGQRRAFTRLGLFFLRVGRNVPSFPKDALKLWNQLGLISSLLPFGCTGECIKDATSGPTADPDYTRANDCCASCGGGDSGKAVQEFNCAAASMLLIDIAIGCALGCSGL